MRCSKLFRVCPLHVIDDVTAVLAPVQIDRNETGLSRHEARAFDHEPENFILIVGRQLDRRDLGANTVTLADFGHKTPPVPRGDNAWPSREFRRVFAATARYMFVKPVNPIQ
jgi:hypothetical protein